MTNIGPLVVNYKWSFIIDHHTLIEKSNKNPALKAIKEPVDVTTKSLSDSRKDDVDLPIGQPSPDEVGSMDMAVVDLTNENHQQTNDEDPTKVVLENIPIHMDLTTVDIKQPINEKLDALLQQDTELNLPSYEEASTISNDF
jgi:hypothetical protein